VGFRRFAVSYTMKAILSLLCKIDCREYIKALSINKPMLVIINHINFLEVPVLVAFSYPLYVTGLAKSETWKNPLFAFLFNTYKSIPIDRSGSFINSFKKVRDSVSNGVFTCIAPEGTRNKDGVLSKGKAGIIQLAAETNIPILPVAHYGGEKLWKNIKKLKRTNFVIKAGKPFFIKCEERPCKEERESIMNEVMGQIASLLPENMRGIYSLYAHKNCKYLDFI